MYKFLLCSTIFIGSIQPLNAEELSDAIAYAVANHPTIDASHAAELGAKQSVIEEKSALYPVANLGANFGRAYSNTTTTRGLSVSRGVGYSWVGEGSARLNQTIYDWSATNNAVNAAQSRYHLANATTETQITSISLQAMQAYLQLLRAKTLLDEANTHLGQMNDYFNRIQTAFDNGGADESEVSRAQDLVSLTKNAIVQYESDLQIAQASFREVVGREPEGDIEEPALNLSYIPKTLEESMAMALSLNPQMKVEKANVKANYYDLKREQVNMMPTLDAEISAFKKDQKDLIGGESEDVRGLVRMNWDYAFGGADRAAQDRVAFGVKEAEFKMQALKRIIERDVEVAWVSLNLAKQQKLNEEDRLEAAEQTAETFQEQYEGGQQKMLDVMGVMNSAFLAKQDYLNIKYQEMNAAYTLMNVIGLPMTQKQEDENVASSE